MRTYLCRMGDLMSEFGIAGLKQVYVVDAESFEDACSREGFCPAPMAVARTADASSRRNTRRP